jgi:hypothetical protein
LRLKTVASPKAEYTSPLDLGILQLAGHLHGIFDHAVQAVKRKVGPERDGLIALGRDELDKRRRPVRLTSAGREAVTRTRPYWTEAHRRFAGFFGEQAMAELRATLRDIAESPDVASAFDRSGGPG